MYRDCSPCRQLQRCLQQLRLSDLQPRQQPYILRVFQEGKNTDAELWGIKLINKYLLLPAWGSISWAKRNDTTSNKQDKGVLDRKLCGWSHAGEVVAVFFLSKSYLQKQFKKYIGISPWDYLLQLRMTEGKRLLRTSDFSVHEIAWRVGFNDVSYFVQVFRNLEKITPLQYRILWTSNQLPFSNWTSKESYGNSAERMRYQQGIDNTGFHVSVLQVRGRCCQCVCNWMIREPNTIRHDFSPEVQAIKDKRVFAPI